jgi:diacylglycerol kinase
MASHRSLWRSFSNALNGLLLAARTEPNFQIHILATVTVIALVILLLMLLLVITAVLILELVNIAIERFADIMKPRIHHYARVVKDVTAAAVLIASLGALVIGIVILLPYVLDAFAS